MADDQRQERFVGTDREMSSGLVPQQDLPPSSNPPSCSSYSARPAPTRMSADHEQDGHASTGRKRRHQQDPVVANPMPMGYASAYADPRL